MADDFEIFDPYENGSHETVNFGFRVDGTKHKALVTYEALRDHFGANDTDVSLIQAFSKNADAIVQVAAKKLERGDEEPVRVSTADF